MSVGERWRPMSGQGGVRCLLLAAGLLLLSFAAAPGARAQDPAAQLSDAESAMASAEAEVASAEAELAPARDPYVAASRRAVPAERAAGSAQRQARLLKAELARRQRAAANQVAHVEADHESEVDDHDRQVASGIALAIVALAIGAIALGWGWFRESPPVVWLSAQPRTQAIGLCLAGGFVLIVLGAALSGAVDALGTAIFMLGFVLPIAVLIARHSVQVEQGKAKPWTKRQRMPDWTTRALAGAMLVLLLVGIGAAISAADPEPVVVPAQLQRVADGEDAAANRRLAEAEAEAGVLEAKASRLSAARRAAHGAFRRVRNELIRAEGRLAGAEGEARRATRRLAAVTARETREQEEQEEIEFEEFEEVEEESEGGSGECDPDYVGACLDPTSPDYDCAGGSGDGPDYTGPVQVVGSDRFGLDADGDGYGCE